MHVNKHCVVVVVVELILFIYFSCYFVTLSTDSLLNICLDLSAALNGHHLISPQNHFNSRMDEQNTFN